MTISYGSQVPNDAELRLCGDVNGKRVIELGVSRPSNAVAMARAGAKAIAVDTDTERLAAVRHEADEAEVHVQCLRTGLADLGEVGSASADLVLSVQSLNRVDDLSRLLRQVHRVLRPSASFVVAIRHPVAEMFDHSGALQARYGDGTLTMSELYMAFERTNFHIDSIHELAAQRAAHVPSMLILRARKEGI